MLMTATEYDRRRAFEAGYDAGWDTGQRGYPYHLHDAMRDFLAGAGRDARVHVVEQPSDNPSPFGTFWAGPYEEATNG